MPVTSSAVVTVNVVILAASGVARPRVMLLIEPPVNVALLLLKLFAIVAPLSVLIPETVRAFTVAAPVAVIVVNVAAAGVTPPITVPFRPPVKVTTPDALRVVNAPLDGIVAPTGVAFNETACTAPRAVAPVDVKAVNVPADAVVPPMITPLTVPPVAAKPAVDTDGDDTEAAVTLPDAATVVNAPVDGVPAPTGVLSIEPPVITALAVLRPPDAVIADVKDALPVTASVPPRVVLPVTLALAVVRAPVVFSVVNRPVEAVVAPIATLLIVPPFIAALANVDAPVNVAAPLKVLAAFTVNVSVPASPRVVLPRTARLVLTFTPALKVATWPNVAVPPTVTISSADVPTEIAPVAVRPPLKDARPVVVCVPLKVAAAATDNEELNAKLVAVVAPVREVAPVTDNVPPTVAAPVDDTVEPCTEPVDVTVVNCAAAGERRPMVKPFKPAAAAPFTETTVEPSVT